MARGKLLILDDDVTVGQILLLGAQASGFEARLCGEVAAFFELLDPWAPTHVAIDLTLPDTSGVAVLRRLSQNGCRARVLICSGAGAAELDAALAETRALGLDGAGVLSKPYTLARLLALIG
jgi:DNA-binding response OmpR family regulator